MTIELVVRWLQSNYLIKMVTRDHDYARVVLRCMIVYLYRDRCRIRINKKYTTLYYSDPDLFRKLNELAEQWAVKADKPRWCKI